MCYPVCHLPARDTDEGGWKGSPSETHQKQQRCSERECNGDYVKISRAYLFLFFQLGAPQHELAFFFLHTVTALIYAI